jgi:hypothetical protein
MVTFVTVKKIISLRDVIIINSWDQLFRIQKNEQLFRPEK